MILTKSKKVNRSLQAFKIACIKKILYVVPVSYATNVVRVQVNQLLLLTNLLCKLIADDRRVDLQLSLQFVHDFKENNT